MKTIFTLRTGLLLAFIMALTNMVAQTTGDYRTTAATDMNLATGWETYDGTNWISATTPPLTSSTAIPNLYVNHNTRTMATSTANIGNIFVNNAGSTNAGAGATYTDATLGIGGTANSSFTFTCQTLTVATSAKVEVTANSNSVNNFLTLNGGIGGNVISNSGTIDFRTSSGGGASKVNTNFTTNGNTAVTGAGTTGFNNITVLMGANTNILDVQSVITMATAVAAPTLTLTSGTFKLSSASTLTAFGGNATTTINSIPTAAGLYLNNAGANINWGTADATLTTVAPIVPNTSAMTVAGKLTIDSGNLEVKARFNVGGSATIQGTFTMNGGSLTIPGAFTLNNTTAPMLNFASGGTPTVFSIVTLNGGVINIGNYNQGRAARSDRDISIQTTILGTGGTTFNITTQDIVYITNTLSGTSKTVGNITVGTGATLRPVNNLAISGTLTLDGGIYDTSYIAITAIFQNGNTPIVRTANGGSIKVANTTNLTFGVTGFTGGNTFVIPADAFTPATPAISSLSINRTNALTLNGQALTITGTGSNVAAGSTLNIPVGTTLNINEGRVLTNSGTIANNGDLILKSSVTGTANLRSDSSVNNVTQQRYLSSNQRGWRLLSNPLATTTFGTLATNSTTPLTLGNGASGAYDSATNTWSSGTDTDPMASQQAYKVFVRGRTSEVTGTSYSVSPPSNVTVAIKGAASNTAPSAVATTAGQYYLVANPYTAPVSVYTILGASTGLSSTVSYYNPTIASSGSNADLILKYGGYATPTITAAAQGDANDVVLPPMGAIFVQATSDGTINVPKTAIFTGTVLGGSYNQKTAQTKVTSTNALKVEISSNGTYYDTLALQFKAVGDTGTNIDFGKLPNTVLDLYSINGGNKMAVSELELKEQTIPLGITSTIQKSYTINVAENTIPTGYEAVLVDNVLNTNTVLTTGTTYNFAIDSNPTSQGDARFAINLKTAGSLGVAANELDASIQVYPNPSRGQFNINNTLNQNENTTIEISSLNGQVIHTQKLNSGTTTIQTKSWAAGVYILKAANNGTQTTKKLLIQ